MVNKILLLFVILITILPISDKVVDDVEVSLFLARRSGNSVDFCILLAVEHALYFTNLVASFYGSLNVSYDGLERELRLFAELDKRRAIGSSLYFYAFGLSVFDLVLAYFVSAFKGKDGLIIVEALVEHFGNFFIANL